MLRVFCCSITPKNQKNNSTTIRKRQQQHEEYPRATDMVALRSITIDNINTNVYQDLKSKEKKYEQLTRETKERLDEMTKIHQEQLVQLKEANEKKDDEIKRLNSAMAKEVTAIGYNKDTWYTLSSELQTLAGKFSNLPINIKKSFNPGNKLSKDDIVKFFSKCWTADLGYDDNRREVTIRKVEELFRDRTMNNIYEIVGVLVEKLLSDYCVHKIYLVPTHTGFHDQNKAYECIDDLLKEKNAKAVKELRVMMSNAISTRIESDKSWKEIRAKSKKDLTEEVTNCLGQIYNAKEIKPKVKDIIFKAVSLSFPMHSQRYDIIIHNLETDGELYTNEVDEYNISYGTNPNKVFLGVLPVIYSDEPPLEDENADNDDSNGDESEEEEEEEDNDESGDSDDENYTSKKETKKGKQKKKQKKIENIGIYKSRYRVMKGKAIGYELR